MAPAPDRRDPEWEEPRIATAEISRARQEIIAALFDSAAPILVTAPSGHGKTPLLRSLWRRPPKGFAAILAPCAGVAPEPDAIAEHILAQTRTVPMSQPAASFVRMLRTQSLRGARPLLLIDDLHAVSPATAAALVALAGSSRVEVRWIAAGVAGPDLDAVLELLPGPPHVFALDRPVSSEDVPREVARVAPVEIESAIAPPEPARPSTARVASSEPAATEIPAAALRPVRAAAPIRAAPPRTPRGGRARPPTRRRGRVIGALAACAVLVWLIDRAPSIDAGSLAVLGRLATVSVASMGDAWRWIAATAFGASGQLGELGADATAASRRIAASAAQWATASASDLARRARAAVTPAIPVGVNSDPWSNVEVDGAPVGPTPLTIELAPGPHRFRAAMADGRVLEKEFVVGEAQNQVVFD
jgi:AAA domain